MKIIVDRNEGEDWPDSILWKYPTECTHSTGGGARLGPLHFSIRYSKVSKRIHTKMFWLTNKTKKQQQDQFDSWLKS